MSTAQTTRHRRLLTIGLCLTVLAVTARSTAAGQAQPQTAARPLAEPLLLRVRPDTPAEYVEANRLLSFPWVRPAPVDVVPTNSILREFVGGSVLEIFKFVTGDGSPGRFA